MIPLKYYTLLTVKSLVLLRVSTNYDSLVNNNIIGAIKLITAGLVSGVVYQLFVSAETDITSQILDSEFDNRSVHVALMLALQDSPNIKLITGVTASVAVVAAIVITVSTALTIVYCRRNVQQTSQSYELPRMSDAKCQSDPSSGSVDTGVSESDVDKK